MGNMLNFTDSLVILIQVSSLVAALGFAAIVIVKEWA